MRNDEDQIADLNDDMDSLNNDLDTAINQIGDLEQYTRKQNLEIHDSSEGNISELHLVFLFCPVLVVVSFLSILRSLLT